MKAGIEDVVRTGKMTWGVGDQSRIRGASVYAGDVRRIAVSVADNFRKCREKPQWSVGTNKGGG